MRPRRGGIMRHLILIFLTLYFFVNPCYPGSNGVVTVDFLADHGLKINGAGPLLVRTDIARNRMILVNTNTSSISLISSTGQVTNIPVKSRVPQYIKSEALAVDSTTGNIYIIGNRSLHIVFPDRADAITIATGEQYDMPAIFEKNGNAFLVGRGAKSLAMVHLKTKKIEKIKWLEHSESMGNLNATPPPPIRKVICDNQLEKVAALDGFTSTLYLFSARTGKLLKKRKLPVKGGVRWHMAGYNQDNHFLYTVIETEDRRVIEGAKIDIASTNDIILPLPELHEGVGVAYNPKRDEIYMGYDNDPSVHIIDFKAAKPGYVEVKVPTYGNDAAAIDIKNNILYMASWGYGNVSVIDLEQRRFIKRIEGTGVIPHMFNIAYNPGDGRVYIPRGASAVNGSFGASLDRVNPADHTIQTIYTGWAPVALVELKHKEGFLVFNSENQAAEVSPDGSVKYHTLPCRFINNAIMTPSGTVYVSYGPHQSYWPTVYIWAAKNGILNINPIDMTFYDRRTSRLAHDMTLDKNGLCYLLQNNWGNEEQFLFVLPDDIRQPNLGWSHLNLKDKVTRETTQRILRYDRWKHWLYILRLGETNDEPGILQIYDIDAKKTLLTYPTGHTPSGMALDEQKVYVCNFDDDTIAAIDKNDFSIQKMKTGKKPFQVSVSGDTLYCINHNSSSLQAFRDGNAVGTYPLPFTGKPSALFDAGDRLIITVHSDSALHIVSFHPQKKTFTAIHKEEYPFGETTVDTDNTSFYMRGQFADAIFTLNQIKKDSSGRIWVTDYLSGKLFIF